MSEVNLTHMGVDLVVYFDYSPAEEPQHYGDAPYPGCPEEIEIGEVFVGGQDISSLLDSDVITELERKVLEMRDA
jgi:hypothetical protein